MEKKKEKILLLQDSIIAARNATLIGTRLKKHNPLIFFTSAELEHLLFLSSGSIPCGVLSGCQWISRIFVPHFGTKGATHVDLVTLRCC